MPKIIITGPTCSGKTSLKNRLVKKGMLPIVQFTTRGMRKGETEGIDYNFIGEAAFIAIRDQMFPEIEMKLVCYNTYGNGTTYGITEGAWKSGQVLAVGMGELAKIPKELLKECLVVYLDIERDTLRQRLLDRGDSHTEAERRLGTDAEDYRDFDFWDIRVTDPNNFII